jgi:hypothetical protein
MTKFLLFFRGGWPNQANQSDFIVTFGQWISSLGRGGKILSGERLKPTGRVVSGDGAFDLHIGHDTSGGFIVVEAKNYDDAVSLTAKCPLLENGGKIEIREIEPMQQM